MRAGDDPPGIFYLKSGRVKEYIISKAGEEVVVNIFKPGAYFPMSWAINKTQNNYFFESIEDLTLIKAPTSDVLEFIKSDVDVLYNLLSRVYVGTDGLLTRMTYLMSGSAHERIIGELVILAKRFSMADSEKITVKISEKDLASQCGMTRETVSRELKKLKSDGVIVLGKKEIIIVDMKRLESEIASNF